MCSWVWVLLCFETKTLRSSVAVKGEEGWGLRRTLCIPRTAAVRAAPWGALLRHRVPAFLAAPGSAGGKATGHREGENCYSTVRLADAGSVLERRRQDELYCNSSLPPCGPRPFPWLSLALPGMPALSGDGAQPGGMNDIGERTVISRRTLRKLP